MIITSWGVNGQGQQSDPGMMKVVMDVPVSGRFFANYKTFDPELSDNSALNLMAYKKLPHRIGGLVCQPIQPREQAQEQATREAQSTSLALPLCPNFC